MPYKAQTKFRSGGKGFIYNLKQSIRNNMIQCNHSKQEPQLENDITIRIEDPHDSLSDTELVDLEEAIIMLLNMRYNKILSNEVEIIRSLASHDEPSYVQQHTMLNILKQLV